MDEDDSLKKNSTNSDINTDTNISQNEYIYENERSKD